ncbi:MAG: hypothetical protein ACE5HU_07670 [Acidobacteriota bacterium]
MDGKRRPFVGGRQPVRPRRFPALSLIITTALTGALLSPVWGSQTRPSRPDRAGIDRSILDDPGRPADERAQDAGRKALQVYRWLGIRPGMTVADAFCSSGYNTHLLSRVVGDDGKVDAIFEFYADKEAFDGRLYKVDAVKERIAKSKLNNVELFNKIADVPANSVNVVLAVRNYHDVEWVFHGATRKEIVAAMYRAVKPGGIVGIVEVATDKPGWNKETHRLNERVVVEDFTSGGFVLAGRSDMLANPDDDHSTNGFKQGRYKQDRYLLKFRKPPRN